MSVQYRTLALSAIVKRAYVRPSTKPAAGHAVAARGGDGVARPANREPTARLQVAAGILVLRTTESVKAVILPSIGLAARSNHAPPPGFLLRTSSAPRHLRVTRQARTSKYRNPQGCAQVTGCSPTTPSPKTTDPLYTRNSFGPNGPWYVLRGHGSLAPSTLTREPTGWQPTHPGLIEDLEKATTSPRRDLQADRAPAAGRMAARMP